MDIKQAASIMRIQKPVRGTKEKIEAFDVAIRSLEAWDKVIAEVKKQCGCDTALNIIEKHLEGGDLE